MYTVLLVIHTLITLALIVIILVQRNAGDGFGMSGNSSSNMLSGRAQANLLTRTTSILAGAFITTSLILGIMVSQQHQTQSIAEQVEASAAQSPTTPEGQPAADSGAASINDKPAAPATATPVSPAVPQSE